MANFRRRRPRTRTSGKRYDKWKGKRLEARGIYYYWMGSWPSWWDILFHRRPTRRAEAAVAGAVMRGEVDPDAALWPLEKKPHKYYW